MDINELLNLDSALFNEQKDISKSKALFKRWVKSIEIEAFSYCNRVCWFCPNSFIDRKSANHFLDISAYEKLLSDLAEVDYDGLVSFSRYNEPFSSEEIYNYISLARKNLPKARLHSNSNGDYFSLENMQRAIDAGLNSMVVQIYVPKNHNNRGKAFEYKERFDKQHGKFCEQVLRIDREDWLEWDYVLDNFRLSLRWRNFDVNGVNRSNILMGNQTPRFSPCLQPVRSIYVDYNGSIMPCCNLRSDFDGHKACVLGNICESRIFDIYTGVKSSLWRNSLRDFSEKQGVCKNCHFDECNLQQVGKGLLKVNKELRDLKYTTKKRVKGL
jgi:MoaA/NifB/PqqE/SkfB family radical SAM enzyme